MLSRTAGTLFTAKPYTICNTLACQNLITRQKSEWQKGQNALHNNLKFWRVRTLSHAKNRNGRKGKMQGRQG